MAFKLKVIDPNNGIAFDCKWQNLKKTEGEKDVLMFSPEGKECFRKQLDKESKKPANWGFFFIDTDGKLWEEEQIVYKKGDVVVQPCQQTKVFTISAYRPIREYLDRFIVDSFKELAPETSMEGKKKNMEAMERIRISNLVGMRKLWEKLDSEQLVAGGKFNAKTGTLKPGMAFIRAVRENGVKWTLELGVFKEEKVFQFMNEGVPDGNAIVRVDSALGAELEANLL